MNSPPPPCSWIEMSFTLYPGYRLLQHYDTMQTLSRATYANAPIGGSAKPTSGCANGSFQNATHKTILHTPVVHVVRSTETLSVRWRNRGKHNTSKKTQTQNEPRHTTFTILHTHTHTRTHAHTHTPQIMHNIHHTHTHTHNNKTEEKKQVEECASNRPLVSGSHRQWMNHNNLLTHSTNVRWVFS